MLLTISGSCVIYGVLGAAIGATTAYIIFNINGSQVRALVPKSDYNSSEISVSSAASKTSLLPNYLNNHSPNLVKGRSFSFDNLLAFMGKIEIIANQNNVSADKLYINAYFGVSNEMINGVQQDNLDIIFVPGYNPTPSNNANLIDFNGFDTSNNPIRITSGIPQIELMNNGNSMPPPMNGMNLL